jgi:hypothetical protein
MVRRVALVRTDVSEERMASIIGVKRISELGTTLTITNNNQRTLRKKNIHSFHPDDGGDTFLRKPQIIHILLS